MKLEHWHAVLAAHREAREWLERALPAPAAGEQQPSTRVGMEAMQQLQQRLLGLLNSLREALASGYSAAQVEELLQPYVYLLDELVLRRLSRAEQPLWPLIQQRLFGEDSGGDHFFDLADARLDHAETPVTQLELLYFCLLAGFQGRHSDNAAKLHEYKEQLKARIPRPAALDVSTAAPLVEPMPIYEFPLRYYLATGLVVALLPVVLWWLSNT
jgi:type VI secretion system protein ImpK